MRPISRAASPLFTACQYEVRRRIRCSSPGLAQTVRFQTRPARIRLEGPRQVLQRAHQNDESSDAKQTKSAPWYETHYKSIRFIIAVPILLLALIHSPYELMNVTGDSMSPYLNPNYDRQSDILNRQADPILVQRHKILDSILDVNEGRRNHRQAQDQQTGKKNEREEEGHKNGSKYQRGQIVVFNPPHNPGHAAIKRVVGLPGDRVQPLAGYPGGDDPVIVPWNHLWVEGDANSRERSVDSNWYGPISQNLIIGEAKYVLKPWWRPTSIDWKTHKWPALRDGRVQEAAVAEEASDPQVLRILREWTDGTNKERLEAMRETPEMFAAYFASSEDIRKRVRMFYRNAALILARDDPDSDRWALAQDVIGEMEKIYGQGALRQGMVRRSQPRPQSEKMKDIEAAKGAEDMLKTQGWGLQRYQNGKVITRST